MGSEKVAEVAESQLGSPYVYGTWGQLCTPDLRKRYARYNPSQKEITYKRCPVLSDKQKKCTGCKYDGRLAFDCRGFTHYCLLKGAGIDIYGQTVTIQYNTKKNWDERGTIDQMPNLVCCVFLDGHTGLHVGDGRIIHCSGEVKEERLGSGRKWLRYAIPKGLYTQEEIENARGDVPLEIVKYGSRGPAVKNLQELLNLKGYDCGSIDGVFGKKTESALKHFQEVNELDPDGVCGHNTWAALIDAPELDDDDDEIPEIPQESDSLSDVDLRKLRTCLVTALDIIDKIGGGTDAGMDC